METKKQTDVYCLNCGAALEGNFCSHCGQASSTGRITFRETIQSFLSSAFSLEGPYLSTLMLLIRNPGRVLREFIEGRRKTYYKPIPFFLLNTAIYLIIRSLMDFDPLEGLNDSIRSSQVSIDADHVIRAQRFMRENINNFHFIQVFSIAASLKIFFRKRYNITEFAVAGFYIIGSYMLAAIIFMLIIRFFSVPLLWYQLLFLMGLMIYMFSSFLQKHSFGSLLIFFLVAFFSLILYMVIGFGLSYLIVS